MGMWEATLPKRIPDYLQGDSELTDYLSACGSVLDDLVDTIKEHDVYKDYKLVPEQRLGLLAKRFAFEPPVKLPEAVMRGILRDISILHRTRGVEASLYWVFKILSWDVKIKYAWLPNPERYDPNVRELFPSFYVADGFDVEQSAELSYEPKIGEPYTIGTPEQLFHNDQNFIIDGDILIGRSPLRFIGIGDEYDPYTPVMDYVPTTDIMKMDYRNFLYGSSFTDQKGTYFKGRGYFDNYDTAYRLRIIGEAYDESKVSRSSVSVISTPYVVVEVSGQNFEKFTAPYIGDDGKTYTYTSKETYNTAEMLIDYLLHNFTRPANVKILMIASREEEFDVLEFDDVIEEAFNAEPQGFTERFQPSEYEEYDASMDRAPVIGDDFLYIGMPSLLLTNSMVGYQEYKIGDPIPTGEFIIDSGEFIYETGTLVFAQENGLYVTKEFQIRTPSRIRVNMPVTSSINIEGKKDLWSGWERLENTVTNNEVFELYDVNYIRFVSDFDLVGTHEADIKWLPQTSLTQQQTTASLRQVNVF